LFFLTLSCTARDQCLWLEDVALPRPVKSEDNCLPHYPYRDYQVGMVGWEISLVVTCIIWICCLCVRAGCGNPNVQQG
jgi:hypothetical protein